MTFFGSTANDAAFNAWLTDTTDSNNRGHVEGVNSAMPLIAVLVVFGGKMLVDSNDNKWTIIFLVIGILILLVGILGIFIIKEPKLEKKNDAYFKNIFYGFRPSVMKENNILYILFAGMMIFSISIQVFMPYLIIYFERTIQLTNYVFVFAPAIIVAAIFTVFYGRFIEKLGYLKSGFISLGLYLFGLLFLTISPNVVIVFIGTLTMMMGYLSLSAVFNTKIRDYTPTEKIGLFQGGRIFTAVLVPMLIGPWIGSMISGTSGDFGFGVVDPGYIPSNLMFVGALVVGVLTIPFIIITSRVMKNRKAEDVDVKL
jgi:MFS family permease